MPEEWLVWPNSRYIWRMIVIDGTFFPPEHSCYFLPTLQTLPLVPSEIFRARAQHNVTAVTLRAAGYASVSWAWDYDGLSKVQPDLSHMLWSRMVNPTGNHMCSLNQGRERHCCGGSNGLVTGLTSVKPEWNFPSLTLLVVSDCILINTMSDTSNPDKSKGTNSKFKAGPVRFVPL